MKNDLMKSAGITTDQFLHNYWQKKPLLIPSAFPGFDGLLNPQQLIELACAEDVQARVVTQSKGQFDLRNSPFKQDDFSNFGRAKWTVLVQGVNHHLSEAAELLNKFSFIPHARLDDLMVSYAPKGGGVGPHLDSYDVFLLQGSGHRRWQIATQADPTLIEGSPLRILKDFKVEQEWVLAPGDMLYLPPHCAHNGVAEDDCMTYSIGFRTPAYQELAEQFLVYLQDRIEVNGMYEDAGLKRQEHPSEISASMLHQVEGAIKKVRWDKEDVANFLGCYLSEPKPNIYFDAPEHPENCSEFRKSIAQRGVKLNLKSLMLCHDGWVFVNGEGTRVAPKCYVLLRKFADDRRLPALKDCGDEAFGLLCQWYHDGYISMG